MSAFVNTSSTHIAKVEHQNDLGRMFYDNEIGYPFVASDDDGNMNYSWSTLIVKAEFGDGETFDFYTGAGHKDYYGGYIDLSDIYGGSIDYGDGIELTKLFVTSRDNENAEGAQIGFWYEDPNEGFIYYDIPGDSFSFDDVLGEGYGTDIFFLEYFRNTDNDQTTDKAWYLTIGRHPLT